MEHFKFSNSSIRKIQPEVDKRLEFGDKEVPGLVLRVTPNGTKTFCVFRRVSGGKPVRITIGKFELPWSTEDARKKAKQIMSELALSSNPNEAKRRIRDEITLNELFERYEADRNKAGKRSVADMRAQYERYLGRIPDIPPKKHGKKRTKPVGSVDWSNRKLSEINHEMVEALHTRIACNKPTTANRIHELLRALYGFAIKRRLINENPAEHITPAPEVERTRHLLRDEIGSFFSALEQEHQPWRDYFTLLLFIGYRRSAIASMQWSDVDLDLGVWRVRGEQSKNGEPIVLPVTGEAIVILKRRYEDRNSKDIWVFPGGGRNGHITSPEKAWARILERAEIPNLRPHDLRHTLASWMINNGIGSLPAIGRVLGHKDSRSTQRYAHLITDTATAAVSVAHAAMQKAITGKLEGNEG